MKFSWTVEYKTIHYEISCWLKNILVVDFNLIHLWSDSQNCRKQLLRFACIQDYTQIIFSISSIIYRFQKWRYINFCFLTELLYIKWFILIKLDHSLHFYILHLLIGAIFTKHYFDWNWTAVPIGNNHAELWGINV